MVSSPLKLVFFSSSHFVLPILESIINSQDFTLDQVVLCHSEQLSPNEQQISGLTKQHLEDDLLKRKIELKLVVSQPDRELRQTKVSNPVSEFARKNQIPLFLPEKINKEFQNSSELMQGFDFGIVASFGQIISQSVLDLAQYKFVNWHPSDLPKYRGASPMSSLLYNGENQTALSWIEMTKEMDAGDIWLKIGREVNKQTTFTQLAKEMGDLGAKTWSIVIAKIILAEKYNLKPIPQDHSIATFCGKQTKEDAIIKPSEMSAKQVFNHWRAFVEFPKTKFYSKYFKQLICLNIAINIWDTLQPLKETNWKIVNENEEWLQLKGQKQVKTLLKCKEGFVEVKKITLSNGKSIDFRGFCFS